VVQDTLRYRYAHTPDYYLTRGKHRVRIVASRGLRTVWVNATSSFWAVVDTDDVPSNKGVSYYIDVPKSGKYYVEVENSLAGIRYGNDVFIEVW
jgi:hypothetical protein